MPIEIMGIKLYSLEEVGQKLGVSYTTAKNYHRLGRIKGQRIGRQVYVTEDELKRFVSGETVNASS